MHPYSSLAYASAFEPWDPIYLPNAETYVLRRPIPGTNHFDAMGCYPVCVLSGSPRLSEDMQLLTDLGCASIVLVTDCLTQPSAALLSTVFDRCREYKTHFVFDRHAGDTQYTKHHRDRVRRALKSCETRVVSLADYLTPWLSCYQTLVERKQITGVQNFSARYFERLSQMSDATLIGAFADGQFVSGHIWMRGHGVVYAHLAASTELGYKLRAAFPIYDHAIRIFGEDSVIDFGGGAGVEAGATDGLADFKRGFANSSRGNFLCGKVLIPELYRELSRGREETNFFPAYRAPQPAS